MQLITQEPNLVIQISSEEIEGLFHINMTRKILEESIPKIDVANVCERVGIEPGVITDLALIPFESMLNRLFSIAEALHCHNI